ncbi:juvenile hormone esterase-like [Ischnura elegans]|uniref:juvenile hormone esterase-like n=1 Tax=Ischnura elegans TaxID=197161 RepID=UPI001ED8847E|nr:juvenile hormone esterase-like [Ischnura elegans]
MKLSICIATLLSASLLLYVGASRDEASDNPVVRTPLGAVRGTTMISRSGRAINAFRGMRYAKPPVGELRFKPPVPITKIWDGIKNATEDGASCPQASDFLSGPTSEDCLFLNVYSTKLPDSNSNPQQPVLVFLHHGGWYEMSSQSSLLGPQYIMDQDIVLVTINNRLGALGFLSTGDSEVPGNNGLKDQLQALKWVHDNIASFGGDANLVTIYGYSAGAASVQYHMASPRSAGLFHRAISSSGSALSSWAITRDPMALTRRQAKLLNCPNAENATSKQIVDCLRDKDAEEIAKSYFGLREWQYDPLVIFAPVIEAVGSSDAPFITEDPYWLFRSGNFSQVPWLTGSTNNEWMRRAKQILDNDTVLADLSQNFERVAPILFYYERDTPSSQRKSRRLHDFYFPDGITKDSLQEITDLYTDGAFLYGADTSVKMISSVSRSPVYYYQFVYRGRFGHMSTEPGMDRPPGAVHHDDLIYVFYPKDIFPFFEDDFPEAVVSKRLVKMWANFARTGNPTPVSENGSDGQMGVSWMPLTPSDESYLEIGEESVMKNSLRQERAAIWEEYIYPKPRSDAGNRYSRRGIR